MTRQLDVERAAKDAVIEYLDSWLEYLDVAEGLYEDFGDRDDFDEFASNVYDAAEAELRYVKMVYEEGRV